MSITSEDVLRMAERAKLRLSASEAAEFTADLAMILEYFDSLASAPASVGEAPVGEAPVGEAPVGEAPELGPPEAPERDPGHLSIDPLRSAPSQFAQHFRDGFFVIPSPPSLGDRSGREPSSDGAG